MKTKNKRIFTGIAAFAAALTIGVLGTTVLVSAMDLHTKNAVELPATAHLGESFTVPDYFYEKDGESVKTEVRILAPNGTVYGGKTLKVDQIGEYVVQYLYEGKVVSSVPCLVVRRSTDMFSVNKYAEIQGIEQYSYTQAAQFAGVQAKVSAGAEIVFNREIDMTEREKDEVLLQMLVSPSVKGERDFGQMILTFTDAVDKSVTMTVVASDGNLDSVSGSANSYVRASGNGQISYGREYKDGQWIYNDVNIYGSPAPFSFEATQGAITDYALNLCYDSDENALYLKNGNGLFYGEPFLIIDFDDPEAYGTNIWSGFPSGKAKLSVAFDMFIKDSGYVIFSEIDGIDLSQESLIDNEAPLIEVDLQGQERAPNSYKGASYSLFDVNVRDFYDQKCFVTAEVKYNDLLSDEWYDVSVADGAFITDKVGKYEIRYSAKDLSGNVSETSLFFYCFNQAEQINIALDGETQYVDVFETVTLPPLDEVRAFGGNGKLDISLTVLAPDGEEIAVENNSFIPDQIGEYTLRYVATDYFGTTGTKDVSLIVSATDAPIFTQAINIPEVMIAGFTYDLPSVTAKHCDNGRVKDAVVKIFVGGNELNTKKYTVPEAEKSLKIEYRAYAADGVTYTPFEKTVPVVDGKNGKAQEAYFYNADGSVTAVQEKNAIRFSFSESGSVFFANKLSRNELALNFSFGQQEVNFSSVTVVLRDSLAAEKTVSLKISFTPLGLNISAPNVAVTSFAMRSDTEASYFALSYNNAQRTIADIDGNSLFALKTNDNGEAFDGFTDGVYVTLRFEGVKKSSEISLTSINNQALGYKNGESNPIGDTVAPQIVVNGEFEKRCRRGENVTIYSADAFDVLGQVANLTLTVYAPDNTCILNRVATDKDYEIYLEQTGRYRVIYEATDSYGNSKGGSMGTNIISIDEALPSLSVQNNLKTVYKVGDTVSLPSYTATDTSGKVNVDIFLELPSCEMRLIVRNLNGKVVSYLSKQDGMYPNSFKVDENTFKLETAGKYTLIYFAYDDAYNYVMQKIELTVVA